MRSRRTIRTPAATAGSSQPISSSGISKRSVIASFSARYRPPPVAPRSDFASPGLACNGPVRSGGACDDRMAPAIRPFNWSNGVNPRITEVRLTVVSGGSLARRLESMAR